MDLKDFVKQTLLDIFDAVQEAGTEIARSDTRRGAIAPMWGNVENVSDHQQAIKFDIAVTASDTNKGETKGRIKVLGIELGGKDTSQNQNKEVSRVSFSIPVALPGTTVEGSRPRSRKGSQK